MTRLLLEVDDVDFNQEDVNGGTPLTLAVGSGQLGAIELLLKKDGIDLNAEHSSGHTSLDIANEIATMKLSNC